MSVHPLISAERLRQVLAYDPQTGLFTWLERLTNKIQVGDVAGHVDPSTGYRRIGVDNVCHHAHRLAWLYVYGCLPLHVDHIDGDQSNNKIANLREATVSENMRNTRIRSDNKSGIKGVSWDRRDSKWYAYIRVHGRSYALGRYDSLPAAREARLAGERKYHGEFARKTPAYCVSRHQRYGTHLFG